jgi:hypothetical protein
MEIVIKDNEASLCCGRDKCPVVKKENSDSFLIKDDFGGSVQLTESQILLVSKAAKRLTE